MYFVLRCDLFFCMYSPYPEKIQHPKDYYWVAMELLKGQKVASLSVQWERVASSACPPELVCPFCLWGQTSWPAALLPGDC